MNSSRQITLYSMPTCPYCVKAKMVLAKAKISYQEVNVRIDDDEMWDMLEKRSGLDTVPQLYEGEISIGGLPEIEKWIKVRGGK